MRRRLTAVLAAAAVLTAAVPVVTGSAVAESGVAIEDSPQLWARVNVCDTEQHPDVIGIRASMPGSGRREALWMRFAVQYRSPDDARWHAVGDGADSGWQRVGVSVTRRVEAGWNFRFLAPQRGEHVLRGAVTFRWTRDGRTVRRLREITVGGHRSARGADPPGSSAATCRIS